MNYASQQAILDFYTYPPIGGDDWRYTHQSARVRALEMQMLSRVALQDMANAENFDQALDMLGAGEYALGQAGRSFAEMENTLQLRRVAVRELFCALCIDEPIVELFKTRDDFSNLRLAVRRVVAGKAIGTDYSDWGNADAEDFEQAFEEQDHSRSEILPDYMRQAVDQAVLAYYQNKDIRQIDYTIDDFQAQYNLEKAIELDSLFLLGLSRIQIDLNNIRTMLRLKFTKSEERKCFLPGGYVEIERLLKGLDTGYEALAPLFFATPYLQVVEIGAAYLMSDGSFLKLERQCEDYTMGYLKTTSQITAGPQPVIAYLLLKENEIRTVRLILTAKKNNLETKLILDRIS
jgi:V/A-type H+-transporting ATPase subunit C